MRVKTYFPCTYVAFQIFLMWPDLLPKPPPPMFDIVLAVWEKHVFIMCGTWVCVLHQFIHYLASVSVSRQFTQSLDIVSVLHQFRQCSDSVSVSHPFIQCTDNVSVSHQFKQCSDNVSLSRQFRQWSDSISSYMWYEHGICYVSDIWEIREHFWWPQK